MAKRKAKPEIARKSRGRIVRLELSLVGSSDGVRVELSGHGKFDGGTGKLSLEIAVPRSLLLFDPTLVAISLLDVLALDRPMPADKCGHQRTRLF